MLLATLALLGQGILAQNTDVKIIDSEAFKNPPNEYRITQYQLTPQTLKTYPEYGIGGTMGFFYSILYPESNKNRYKSSDPAMIGQLVDAANKIDYKVWLADDWGYPSGMAGGRVVAENPDWEVKGLTMLTVSGKGNKTVNYSLPDDLYDIVYAGIFPVKNGEINLNKGREITVGKRNITSKGLNGDWELRIFARYVRDKVVQAQSTMSQFGHTGHYPDLMNKEAMARFIANMHEPILTQIKDPASSVEGFYTNEPNLMQTHWKREYDAPYACAPWSDGLPAQFRKMHGYNLFSMLSYLFEGEDDEARRARIHYRQAVADLLTDSFSRQIREWCNARGIKSSGHFLLNDYLSMHVQGYGDMMKFVSEFDIPALDIPIPNPDEFLDFSYQQSRFFSSVTSWKKRDKTIMLLDPIIGGYGRTRLSPDLPLLVNSVNMASFHGINKFTAYVPLKREEGKVVNGYKSKATGYTPEEYRFFNEYTGRLSQVLQGAKREAGVGLYYPIAMFQAALLASDKFWPKILREHAKRQKDWDHTEEALLKGDIEYMIVHPEGVADAQIRDGFMNIGYGSYHTLVMPQMEYIPLNVLEQLEQFKKAGGKVLWVDTVPKAAEKAKNDTRVNEILKNTGSVNIEHMVSSIDNSFSAEFDLDISPGTDKLTIGRFHKKDEQVYLLINRTQKALSIDIEGQRGDEFENALSVLDPSTGKIRAISLPANVEMKANRALMVVPNQEYISQPMIK
jgi:hypothetical protein